MDSQHYVPALGYRCLTRYYDAVVGATTRERTFKNALIAQTGLQKGQRVLDLACGTGTLSIWIDQSLPELEVHGIDGDEDILSIARRKAAKAGTRIRYAAAMSYDLPYPDAYFDRVVSSLFFHHLNPRDKVRTTAEIYRVLKPGGELHVADWGKPANLAMRTLFFLVQVLDGFENTRENVEGRLVEVFHDAGLSNADESRSFYTMLGTLALYSAARTA